MLTFRRPEGLAKALDSLLDVAEAVGEDIGLAEIIVIDNDPDGSARSMVESDYPSLVRYVHEPTPGVSAARNRALDEASTNRLVFIDDDEHAGPDWPSALLRVMDLTGAALVGGPVRSILPASAPGWARTVDVFNREEPPDEAQLDWLRSGNLAIDLGLIRPAGLRFEEAFGSTGGEDVRFSVQAKRAGLDLRWSADAVVYEDVPASRITTDWVESRAEAAMSNYVRANAPVGFISVLRGLLVACGRAITGSAGRIVGSMIGNQERELEGRVAHAKARGAWHGITAALSEERARRDTQTVSSEADAR